jgi:hypothetical protein
MNARFRPAIFTSVLLAAASACRAADPAPTAPKQFAIPVGMKLRSADLELLACKLGRAHESLVLLDISPEDFLKGMKSIGLRTPEEWEDVTLRGRPEADDDFTEHWGDRVLAFVEWKGPDGRTVRHRAEDLILDVCEGRSVRRGGWVFQAGRGDEVEMPLTFKGLNAASSFGSFLVLPKAYLDDSYRPTIPFYKTFTERLPAAIGEHPGGLQARLIIEPTTEEHIVRIEIDSATNAADKAYHESLMEPAKRIDAAKRRILDELMPKREAAVKAGLALAVKAGGGTDADAKELARAEAEGRVLYGEIKMLHKQIRRDYLAIEIAHCTRDAEFLKANTERLREVIENPVGWKKRALGEYAVLRDQAEHERAAYEERLKADTLTLAAAKGGPAPAADEMLRLRLRAAIADSRAERCKAEIKRQRTQWRLDLEEERNKQILARNGKLNEFAIQIVERLAMHVGEAVRRQELADALIAASEARLALMEAAADAKPAAEKKLKGAQTAADRARARHEVMVLAEKIDDLEFEKEKAAGEADKEKDIQERIDAAKARQKELRTRLGEPEPKPASPDGKDAKADPNGKDGK